VVGREITVGDGAQHGDGEGARKTPPGERASALPPAASRARPTRCRPREVTAA
jgi:hypothetical protein